MIVLSGLLVVVSIVLLAFGLQDKDELTLVYASIGTSIVAGILLILGALQRRGEAPAAAATATGDLSPTERLTAVSVTRPDETAMGESAEPADVAAAASGPVVSVVPGRPRYHVAGCRFLAGRNDVEQVALGDAKGSYTACGVCKPDEALAAAEVGAEVTSEPEESFAEEAAPARRTRSAAASGAPAKGARSTAARSAAKAPARAAAKPAAAKSAAAKSVPGATSAAKSAAKSAPAKAAAKAAPAKAAKSTAATGSVVVIPDRDKFHAESCRFVRDVAGTVTVSKATAKRQGYVACGVCKP